MKTNLGAVRVFRITLIKTDYKVPLFVHERTSKLPSLKNRAFVLFEKQNQSFNEFQR